MVRSTSIESTRSVRSAYVGALLLIALVTVGSQIVIQWSLSAEVKTAGTVNAAGLQRMRSQRLAQAAWIAVYDEDAAAVSTVRRSFADLEATHQRLAAESAEGRSPHSAESAKMLSKVGLILGRFASPVAKLEAGERNPALARELTDLAGAFLPEMDALVAKFAATAEARLRNVRRVEYGLSALVLVLLVLEATLIFAPLTRRLERSERARESLMNRLEVDLATSLSEIERGRSERAVSLVASGVAHDLNNYVQAIVSHSELLAEEDRPNESVTAIRRAAEDCSNLCRQLLALSPSQHASTPETITLGTLAEEVAPLIRGVLPTDLTFKLLIDSRTVSVRADPQQLRQALLNLCINARDACESGGVISLRIAERNGRASIAVEDNGCGIEPDIQNRIFEPFFTTKRAEGGSGLGLAAVAAIVEGHNGQVDVETELGVGTRFELLFPVAPTRDSKIEEKPDRTFRVLYVEDNDSIRRAGVRMLQAIGHQVSEATGESDAKKLAASQSFDVIISDVMLSDTFGPDLVRELREQLGPIPAIFVSGNAGEWDQSLDDGCILVLKPFSKSDLSSAIERVMPTRSPPGPGRHANDAET